MPEDRNQTAASQNFLKHLEDAGFFTQIKDLEKNLQIIAGELKGLAEIATKRLEETESIAGHLLALESILLVLMREKGIEADAVREAARIRTSMVAGDGGSPAVLNIVNDILGRAQEQKKK